MILEPGIRKESLPSVVSATAAADPVRPPSGLAVSFPLLPLLSDVLSVSVSATPPALVLLNQGVE